MVKEWGRKYSNKEGATDEDYIKKGITMLPLARFDDSTKGRHAALVLDEILSRRNVFANFRTDEAIELAKTPRLADTANAAKKLKTTAADAPAG